MAEDDTTAACDVRADDPVLDERLIVAPAAGVFFPAFTDVSVEEPGMVAIGDEVGMLVQSGEKHLVTSPFTGALLAMLAQPGERVRMYQPVAWVSVADEP
jgi:biotin carboxyl carrier protein